MAQTVTVKAEQDDDAANDKVTLTHTATGASTRERRRIFR